ncbi:MAG: SDR family oxidoreductase [Actinomycetota bacterium]|jgi:NAD(P)-dependent dehydrogenase (short-subunit alcohol dehydrogenase family)|nr:SDR family oxidoreductase [Actinomycetota bacterium]
MTSTGGAAPSEAPRVVVVTGANRGIGRAVAAAYGRAGYAVAVTARDQASLDDTVADVAGCGADVLALPCDVADERSVAAAAEAVAERFGRVHTVVANAGIAGPTAPLHELDLQAWRECLAVDLDGVFLTFRAFVPGLLAAGTGSLIAMSSMTGKRPLHGRTPYAAAKMGVIGLVRTLAVELGPHGVRVNAVCPGAVSGPRIRDVARRQAEAAGTSEEEALAVFTSASPLRRLVTAEEVAAACVFLSSDAAASITGEDLNVTAGVVMH